MRKKLSEICLTCLPFDHLRPNGYFGPEGEFEIFP